MLDISGYIRERVNYEGLEKCLADFAPATPTWLYNNKS